MRYTFTRNFLHYMAELEAMFMDPTKPRVNTLRWRKRQLQYMGVSFGKEVFVGQNLFILLNGGVTFGNRCALGSNAQIWNHSAISIGEDFLSASNLVLNSGLHDPLTLQPKDGAITIGDRVWCGIRVTILGGAKIGSDVVIGAGSLVTGEIPSGCIAAGVPARVLRRIDRTGIKIWSAFD
jgi:acetyltransferase-like isoleucine patch superfamily enzyme